MVQILYVFARDTAHRNELLSAYRGVTHYSAAIVAEDIRLSSTSARMARRVANDGDALLTDCGWVHCGVERQLTPQSAPLTAAEFDPSSRMTTSAAQRVFHTRVREAVDSVFEGAPKCWRVDIDPVGGISEAADAWLGKVLESVEPDQVEA